MQRNLKGKKMTLTHWWSYHFLKYEKKKYSCDDNNKKSNPCGSTECPCGMDPMTPDPHSSRLRPRGSGRASGSPKESAVLRTSVETDPFSNPFAIMFARNSCFHAWKLIDPGAFVNLSSLWALDALCGSITWRKV